MLKFGKKKDIKLIVVGLGNPGQEYKRTRHNLGFLVLDCLTKRHHTSFTKRGMKAKWASVTYTDEKVALAKPQTFVNLSGQSIKALLKQFNLTEEELIVVHDDLDLPLGEVRRKVGGGSGGHNGLKSIIDELKTNEITRVRIGIGRPPGKKDPAKFVLEPFSNSEKEEIKVAIEQAADEVETLIETEDCKF